MDMEKFEQVMKKLGGRLRATSVIQKRLLELVGSGEAKGKGSNHSETVLNKILDEILTDQLVVKEIETICESEAK